MSKRTFRDYINQAFFARDKASLAKIVKDAEEELAAKEGNGEGDEDEGHKEPDGDEGKHASNVHVHIEHKGNGVGDADNGTEERLKGCEDGIRKLGDKMSKLFDHLKIKDAKEGEGDGDDDEKDDKDKKTTGDQNGEEGAQTAEALAHAEPELMEADPALKTGRSMMGDAAFHDHVKVLIPKLIQDMAARAEILMPGTQMPTLDAAPGKATQKGICDFRRATLLRSLTTDKGVKAIGSGYTADSIKALSCDAVRMLFNDASQRMHDTNNGNVYTTHAAYKAPDNRGYRDVQAQRLAGINKANSEFWQRQTGRPN